MMKRFFLLLLAVALPRVSEAGDLKDEFCREFPANCVDGEIVETSPEPAPVPDPVTPAPNPAPPAGSWGEIVERNAPAVASGPTAAQVTVTRIEPAPPTQVLITRVEEPAPATNAPQEALVVHDGTAEVNAGKVPWFGAHEDPLAGMVDPNNGAPMTCKQAVGRRGIYHVRVQNLGSSPGRLYVNGVEATVFDYGGKVQGAVIKKNGNLERHSILYPRQVCFLALPETGDTNFEVLFVQDAEYGEHAGHQMHLLSVPYMTLHSTVLRGGVDSYTRRVRVTGQYIESPFGPNQGIY